MTSIEIIIKFSNKDKVTSSPNLVFLITFRLKRAKIVVSKNQNVLSVYR